MIVNIKVKTDESETQYKFEGVQGASISAWGYGSPEGVVTAPFASKFDEFNSSGVLIKTWVKQSASGKTGWA